MTEIESTASAAAVQLNGLIRCRDVTPVAFGALLRLTRASTKQALSMSNSRETAR